MAYRTVANLFPRGKECAFSLWIPYLSKTRGVISQSVSPHGYAYSLHSKRTLHTTIPLLMKLLSVEELFAKRALQNHLRKMETEYSECLKAVSDSVTEEQCSEELRAKRTKVSLLSPLIQSIKELGNKQKDMTETEMLLKGEIRNSLNEG